MSILVAGEALSRYQIMKYGEQSLRALLKTDPLEIELGSIDAAVECLDGIVMHGSMDIEELIRSGYGSVLESALEMFLLTIKQDMEEAEKMLIDLKNNKVEA